MENHIERQVLIAGTVLDKERWFLLQEQLARQNMLDATELYNPETPATRNQLAKYLLSCELLWLLNPGIWTFNGNVSIGDDGKAILLKEPPYLID